MASGLRCADLTRDFHRPLHQPFPGNDLVDEAPVRQRLRIDQRGRVEELRGARRRDSLEQPHRGASGRNDAVARVAVADASTPCGGDDDVAAQQQFQPAGHRDTVYGADHRNRQVLDQLQHVLIVAQRVDQLCPAGLQRLLELDQVAAGAEGAARAGEDDDAQARQAAKARKLPLQRLHHRFATARSGLPAG